MDIAELPEALAALARDLERRDDDPFTLRSRDAVLLAKRTIEDERRWLEQAVGHPGPPASEQEDYSPAADLSAYRDALIERLDNELRFHRELMEIRRTLLGPDHYKIARSTTEALAELLRVADRLRVQAAEAADIQRRAPSAVLLRLASHLLPTFASDEAEMDSPEVDLEAFGIGREDLEAKLLLEHMNLGSGDAGWPHFPVAYVARGLSSYLLAVSKATRRAAMGMPTPAPPIGQCCPRMRTALGPHTCPAHPSLWECPDSVVGALADGRIGLRIHDGGSAVLVIAFCPRCGARLLAGAQTGHHEPRAPSIDLLGFEAALRAAKTPEDKRQVFEQFIPLAKGG